MVFLIKAIILALLAQSFLEAVLPPEFSPYVSLLDKVAIAAFFVFVVIKSKSGIVYAPFSLAAFIVSVFIGLISLFYYGHGESGGILQAFLTFQGVIALFVFSNINVQWKDIESVLDFTLKLGVIVFLLSLVEMANAEWFRSVFHSGNIHEEAVYRGDLVALQSVFGHPGIYAWFMAFCFCVSISFWGESKRKIFLMLSFVFLLGVVFSLRRKSLVAVFLCLLFLLMFLRAKYENKIVYLFLVLAGGLAAAFLLAGKYSFLIDQAIKQYDFGSQAYVGPRVALTKASISIANDHFPLGSGFGTFGSWMSRVNYSDLYHLYGLSSYWGLSEDDSRFATDAYWAMIIAELGWIGLIAVIYFWGNLFVRLCRMLPVKNIQRGVVLAALLVFIELIIESVASPALSRSPQIFIVMLVLGLSFSAYRSSAHARFVSP